MVHGCLYSPHVLSSIILGASVDGEVANFVETEMILTQPGGGHVSHVQIRGSLPLPWSQMSDLSWQPLIQIHQGKSSSGGVVLLASMADTYLSKLIERIYVCRVNQQMMENP